MTITMEDLQNEIKYWESAVVCYILVVKPPFRITDGFIRRVWKPFGVHKLAIVMDNGVFMVMFRLKDDKERAQAAGPILYDRKPVIVKSWHRDLDLNAEDIKVVPTCIKFPGLPLRYWGQGTLNKLVGIVASLLGLIELRLKRTYWLILVFWWRSPLI